MNTLAIHLQVPDLWQNEALQHLRQGKDVVVHAPTGAGKTYIFELLIEAGFHKKAVYTVPTRALANDKRHEWLARNWNVGIATGDVSENLDAPVVVATLETQKPRFLKREGPRLFVVDEYQMLGDPARGVTYELGIALLPPSTQLLLLSGSVGNPEQVCEWLTRIGRNAVLVRHEERPVPQEEIFLEALDARPPSRVTGFWPRLVARALMCDLGPILVFAPQRAAAEKLARHFAAAFPVDEPLALSPEQRHLAGDKLARMLKTRVAYHHSGLSYRQRAGLIEPLAKAGQLRIVVATTGLGAGINFSMRSVLVTDREYRHGFFHEEVGADELLQMFGRAGRRGLDEVGYVLVAPDRPRLGDARPIQLHRSRLVDWPSLIGVMQGAAESGQLPFREAVNACERLFSRRPIPLGVEQSLAVGARGCGLFVDAERARFVRKPEDPARSGRPAVCRTCDQLAVCEGHLSVRTSPALSWRKLGLIDARGTPTRRGIVFSFFYNGEGLAVAAALEDEAYPVDDLVFDLANLRAGHRFSDLEATRPSRLGILCRETYPQEDFPGYLEGGVPPAFGDGAAEVFRDKHRRGVAAPVSASAASLKKGDIERVYVEWRSVLRQVCLAPDLDWQRWRDLKEAAAAVLERYPPVDWSGDFPPLEPSQKRRCSHRLRPFR